MKTFYSLFVLLFAFLVFSCDEWYDDPFPDIILRPISVTGQRYEKYHLEPAAGILSNTITLSSPQKLAYTFIVNGDEQRAYNQITIHDVPLFRFTNNAPFTANVTGTIAVKGVSGTDVLYYSLPFDTEANFTPQQVYFERTLFWVLTNFDNDDDLVLPLFIRYESDLSFQNTVTFEITVTSDLMESFLPPGNEFDAVFGPSAQMETFTIDEVLSANLIAYNDANITLEPVSREFFQYRSVFVVFPQEVILSNIRIPSISSSFNYDPASNTLSVLLFEYDIPFTGDIVNFTKRVEGGNAVASSVSIER